MNNFSWVGPLTWAYVIIIGGFQFTPEGGNPIVTNTAVQVGLGLVGIALGAIGIISKARQLQQLAASPRLSFQRRDLLVVVAATAALLIGANMAMSGIAPQVSPYVTGTLLLIAGIAGFASKKRELVGA